MEPITDLALMPPLSGGGLSIDGDHIDPKTLRRRSKPPHKYYVSAREEASSAASSRNEHGVPGMVEEELYGRSLHAGVLASASSDRFVKFWELVMTFTNEGRR